MTRRTPEARLRSTVVSLVLLAVVAASITFPFASAPATAQDAGTNTSGSSTSTDVVVRQGSQCYPIDPYENASGSVADFYGYRTPYTDPSGWYHAYGPLEDLLREDTSQVFLYRGSDGLSLVFVNDGVSNTSGSGGTATFDVSGLPAEGNWSVQDDSYPGHDDVFDVGGTSAHIEWYWNEGNRSDGGAYAGLENDDWDEITVSPSFNEESPGYPFEKWEGDPEDNQVTSWVARSANGTTYELDMDEPITITRGPCDSEPPTASLTASSRTLTPGTDVTFDASGSSDNDAISEYRWDTDGDGTVDTVTNESSITATYDETGEYDPRVTVADSANNTANATISLQVEERTTSTPTTTTTTTTSSAAGETSASDDGTTVPSGGSSDVPTVPTSVDSAVAQATDGLSTMDEGSLVGLAVLVLALLVIGLVVLRR